MGSRPLHLKIKSRAIITGAAWRRRCQMIKGEAPREPSSGGLAPLGEVGSERTRHSRVDLFHYSPQKYAMMSLQALCGGGCLYGVDCSLKAVQMFYLEVSPGSLGGRHCRKLATAENTSAQHTLFKGNKFESANIIFKSCGLASYLL